jgi:hypothetical protein
MTRQEVKQGIRVDIPANFFLAQVLKNWNYPHPFLAIKEPYSTEDNVRLRMIPPFPDFCVESFNAADLTIYQPKILQP